MQKIPAISLLAMLALIASGCTPKTQTVQSSYPAPTAATLAARQAEAAEQARQLFENPRPVASWPAEILIFTADAPARKAWMLAETEEVFLSGRELYEEGDWEGARAEFDHAVEIFLTSGFDLRADRELRLSFDRLVDRIYEMDLAVARDIGEAEDSVTGAVAAPIDEMVPLTFSPNPELRREVERELAGIDLDMPIVINDQVMNILNYLSRTDRGRRVVRNGLRRKGRYAEMIEKVFVEEGLPVDLINSAQAESSFQPRAVSRARAAGLWQFMSFRAREYGLKVNWWVDERRDPIRSTRAAARHLRDLYEQFGDWYLVLAAYNSGPGRVSRAIERTGYADYWELIRRGNLPRETANHVPIIIAFTLISKDPARYGFDIEAATPLRVDEIPVERPTSLKAIARAVGMDYATLRDLNPHVLHGVTPPDYSNFRLYIPAGTAQTVLAALPEIPEAKRVEWGRHRVRRGQTLSGIAGRYGTSAYSIAQANGISLRSIIRPGQSLVIPGGRNIGSSSRRRASTRRPAPRNTRGKSVYTVRRGDTLSDIAERHGTGPSALARANGISTRSTIRPGQKLVVPGSRQSAGSSRVSSSGSYTVRRGDTLNGIARRHGTTARELAQANGVSVNAPIRVGAKLTIPGRTKSTSVGSRSVANRPRSHSVRSGETLWELSRRYQVTVRDLRRANAFLARRDLQAGDRLNIPPTTTSAAVQEKD